MLVRLVPLTAVVALLFVTAGQAADPTAKCESGKLKESAKYASCRLKAESKAVATATSPDFSKCEAKFPSKFNDVESKAGPGICPSEGDGASMNARITSDAGEIALLLSGARYVDNGDGTVTDLQSGLTWEQKTGSVLGASDICTTIAACTDPHYVNNFYDWSTSGSEPNGMAFMNFLAALNAGTSPDGVTTSGCFANHCDWRLPTIEELATILDCSAGSPCIDPIFGPTASSVYFSSSTLQASATQMWIGGFSVGTVTGGNKTTFMRARAVR